MTVSIEQFPSVTSGKTMCVDFVFSRWALWELAHGDILLTQCTCIDYNIFVQSTYKEVENRLNQVLIIVFT